MRTTIDIPEPLMKRARLKAVEEGISLKELFTRSLEKELSGNKSAMNDTPWKNLIDKGSANSLKPEDSGFEGYTGPDWNFGNQVNDPDNQ